MLLDAMFVYQKIQGTLFIKISYTKVKNIIFGLNVSRLTEILILYFLEQEKLLNSVYQSN